MKKLVFLILLSSILISGYEKSDSVNNSKFPEYKYTGTLKVTFSSSYTFINCQFHIYPIGGLIPLCEGQPHNNDGIFMEDLLPGNYEAIAYDDIANKHAIATEAFQIINGDTTFINYY